MTGVGFLILFGLSLVLFPCQGKIIPPPDGTKFTFLNGSTANIKWSFDSDISTVFYRAWYFKSSDGSFNAIRIASIFYNGKPEIVVTGLCGVTIIKPATLILKNVNQSYSGTYSFRILSKTNSLATSDVFIFIARKPTVRVNCSSPIIVNEGDDVTCVCRGEGGNPAADVTWYKYSNKIGQIGKEEQRLTFSNIDQTASGTYKCVAKSHSLTDEKSIEIIVYYAVPPRVICLTSTPENAIFGKSVVLTCEAIAVPLPIYTIIHNDSEVVSTHKTYIIDVLEYSHAGSYKCIATSMLGNSSKIFSLYIETTRTTNSPTTKGFRNRKATLENSNHSGTEWYIVVVSMVSVVSGIIIGILLSYIVSYCLRKFRSGNPQSNPEPKTTEVDTTYQELDLTKMNTEADNYQSLIVNAASNDDDSTYTELNKTRNEENNYQSLT